MLKKIHNLDYFLKKKSCYNFDLETKNKIISRIITLISFHNKKNKLFKNLVNFSKNNKKNIKEIDKVPFIPINLFKKYKLLSIPVKNIFKILRSSGTTGLSSTIFIDKKNSENQISVLSKIFKENFGDNRFPMLIIDQNPKFKDRKSFDAKTAALLGFSIFGYDHCFLLNKENKIDYKSFSSFIKRNKYKKKFIFGFTSHVYENFIQKFNDRFFFNLLKDSFLVHGGGWKKLHNLNITEEKLKKLLESKHGIKNIINYYGMIEQTGSIFFECSKCGFLKSSIFSDIVIRDHNLDKEKFNRPGLIQVLSLVPTSYPGFSILTEDLGYTECDKSCSCKFKGTRFKIIGRVKEAEVRGCSDV